MRKKRVFNPKSFFTQKMRQQWAWRDPARAEALKQAEVKRSGKTFYRCAITKKLFTIDQVKVDHIDPVVDPNVGWVDYNTYMSRLFCPVDQLQVISRKEHDKKTKREGKLRKQTNERNRKAPNK
jgi:hypothetical protein